MPEGRRMLIRCPSCNKIRAYRPKERPNYQRYIVGADFVNKRATCFYCNKTFLVYENINKNNVVQFNSENRIR